jgi:putative ATPase
MPEGLYPLAHATLYLATAPKSSSVGSAYFAALQDVARTLNAPVPLHLRNAVTGLMRSLDYGKGYVRYAQDHTAPMTPEDASLPPPIRFHENLPEGLHGARYYQPGLYGAEARLRPWLEALRNAPPSPPKPQSRENATGQS